MAEEDASPTRIGRGFRRAGALIAPSVGRAARRRGYAEARLLADWAEIAGPVLAACCRPVKITRARGPLGGTLLLWAEGVRAPEVQMALPRLRERVNAALGWTAVARIQITQAAPGFAEGPAPFATPSPSAVAGPDPARIAPLLAEVSRIGDGRLRSALETLARNVVSREATEDRDAAEKGSRR